MKKILALCLVILLIAVSGCLNSPDKNEVPKDLTKHLNNNGEEVKYKTINTQLRLEKIEEVYTIDKIGNNSYFVQGEYIFESFEQNKSYLMGVDYNVSKNNISVEAIRHIREPERASSVLYEESDGSLNSDGIAYKEYAVISPTGAMVSDFGNTIRIEQKGKVCTSSEISGKFRGTTCEKPDSIDTASLVLYNRRADYHENISKLPMNKSPKHVLDNVKNPTGVLTGEDPEVEATLEWKKALSRNSSDRIKLTIEDVHKTGYGEIKLGYVLLDDATYNSVYDRRSIVTDHIYGPGLSEMIGNLTVNLSDVVEKEYKNPADSKNQIILRWTLLGFTGSDWKVIKESTKVENQPIPTMFSGAADMYRNEKGKVEVSIRLDEKDEKEFLERYDITVKNKVGDLLFVRSNASDLRRISLEREVSYVRAPVKPTPAR